MSACRAITDCVQHWWSWRTAFRADGSEQIGQGDRLTLSASVFQFGWGFKTHVFSIKHLWRNHWHTPVQGVSGSRSHPRCGRKQTAFYGSFISSWVPLIWRGRPQCFAAGIVLSAWDNMTACIILLLVMNWQELCVFLLVLFSALVGRPISLFILWLHCISHPRRPEWLFMCCRCFAKAAVWSKYLSFSSTLFIFFYTISLEASSIKIIHIKTN